MIAKTTTSISITDSGRFRFRRDSEKPGVVYVSVIGNSQEWIGLPANEQEREAFIKAYQFIATCNLQEGETEIK